MNWLPHLARAILFLCVTVVSLNPPSSDYFLVKQSLAASAIVLGLCEEAATAFQILTAMVWLQSCQFGALQLQEKSIPPSCLSYLSLGSCQPRSAIPGWSVSEPSSASTVQTPGGAVQLWQLCLSPSQVGHYCSTCQALYHHNYLSCIPHPPHYRNMQDCSDCLQ